MLCRALEARIQDSHIKRENITGFCKFILAIIPYIQQTSCLLFRKSLLLRTTNHQLVFIWVPCSCASNMTIIIMIIYLMLFFFFADTACVQTSRNIQACWTICSRDYQVYIRVSLFAHAKKKTKMTVMIRQTGCQNMVLILRISESSTYEPCKWLR